MKYDIYSWIIMIAVISFLGFILENVWLAFTKGFIDNRNMSAPFLLGYGLFVVAIYFVIGTPQNFILSGKLLIKKHKIIKYIAYFLIAIIIVSVGEMLLGIFVEKFLGFEYWNYSKIPFHITKYTSIPTSIGFAFVILFFMGVCFNPILIAIAKIKRLSKIFLGILLALIMTIDFFKSFYKMYKTKSLNEKWRIYIVNRKLQKYRFTEKRAV